MDRWHQMGRGVQEMDGVEGIGWMTGDGIGVSWRSLERTEEGRSGEREGTNGREKIWVPLA